MRHMLMITAALGLLSTSVASAQMIDTNGRCHDKAGRFAKAEVCKGAPGPVTAMSKGPAADPNAPYKLDPKGKCHDVKGKMAKKEMCAH